MSLGKPRGRTINGLSVRGFSLSIGSAWVCCMAAAPLVPTLVVALVAYVWGA